MQLHIHACTSMTSCTMSIPMRMCSSRTTIWVLRDETDSVEVIVRGLAEVIVTQYMQIDSSGG